MKLLIECLKEMSEEQLISLLPRGAVDFISDVLDIDSFPRENIAKAIALSRASEFVTVKGTREELLYTVQPSTLAKLFPSFTASEKPIGPAHYELAVQWASMPENHPAFAQSLGVLDEFKSVRTTNTSVTTISRISPLYKLYPYQKEISDKVLKLIKTEKRLLVHLPTGSGKTRTAINIAVEHLRTSSNNLVLWLADREELCQQAFDEFEKAWGFCGDRDITLYGFYSSSSESLGGISSGFIVAGLHTLNSIRGKNAKNLQLLYEKLREQVTLVIFDEAHKAIAEKYKAITEDFIANERFSAKLVGLTATPGRKFGYDTLDNENYKLAEFFHFNKISMEISGYISPIDYLVNQGYLAKANFVSLNYSHSKITGFELKNENKKETFKVLSNNKLRNKKILDTIKSETELGKKVIVFACSVIHAQHISAALNCMGVTSASIDSKHDSAETRRLKIAKYRNGDIQVLTNFNVLTAGFDAPQTSVSVIAKPTNSLVEYLQMAGRSMRGEKSGGNQECWIYNVNDDIPEFQSINLAFEHWNKMWSELD